MTVHKLLVWLGWLLVVWGVLGYLLGSSVAPSWNFTSVENLGHLVVGVVLLLAVYVLKNAALSKWLAVLVGLLALYLALYGFAVSDTLNGASLELLDNLLHLVIGAWALWVAFGKRR